MDLERIRDRLTDWLAESCRTAGPGFLPSQRWFGGKGRAIAAVALEDVAWLSVGASRAVGLSLLAVRYEDGDPERYAVLITATYEEAPTSPAGALGRGAQELPTDPSPEIQSLLRDGRQVRFVEGSADQDSARTLIAQITAPTACRMQRGGRVRAGDVTEQALQAVPASRQIQRLGAEQSNTTWRVGSDLAFKLFRRIEPGENLELEVGRFLSRHASFAALPRLHGALEYVSAQGPGTLGVLQAWVENDGDGWTVVVDGLRAVFAGDTAVRAALSRDAASLASATAACHRALASAPNAPEFAPEPVTTADLDRWSAELRTRARGVWARLRDVTSWPASSRALTREVLETCDDPDGFINRLTAALRSREAMAWHKVRIHGDYHLGQTLHTAQGFVLVDFEGEPALPFQARREKRSVLKDVAGMLRSFDYAGETAGRTRVGAAGYDVSCVQELKHRFLERYLRDVAGTPALVPAAAECRSGWLAFCELDKALYEVEYEAQNRPDWIDIPLNGIARIVGAGAAGVSDRPGD